MRILKRRGFTLVELLVVIAIIAILITLLFPSLKGIKTKVIRVQDMNNLKQFTAACILHAQANQGLLPRGERESSVNGIQGDDMVWCNSGEMFKLLNTYLPERRAFSCIGYHLNMNYTNYPLSYGAVGSWGGWIGWTYWARRKPTQTWTIVDFNGAATGQTYTHLTNIGAPATSRTLAGCMSWTGPGYSGWVSHRMSSEYVTRAVVSSIPFGGTPDIQGINAGAVDGSARWVKFRDCGIVKDVDFMLFDPR